MFFDIQTIVTILVISSIFSAVWYALSTSILCLKIEKRKIVIFCLITSIIQIFTNFLQFSGFFVKKTFLYFLISDFPFTFYAIILIGILCKYYYQNFFKAGSAVFLGYFILVNFYYVIEQLFLMTLPNFLEWKYILVCLANIGFYILLAIYAYILHKFMKKVRLMQLFDQLFLGRMKSILMLFFSFFLMHSYRIAQLFVPDLEGSIMFLVYGAVVAFIIVLALFIAAAYEEKRLKVEAQHEIIIQQQMYVQTLEHLQQQVRNFRHDYKNMMSGMYLQAKEGDISGIINFMEHSMDYFDNRLGKEIKQSTQLSNLHVIEVKSLLLVKGMEAEKLGISYNIEVLNPVHTINMEVEDFNRCLGILMDNGIEAASEDTHEERPDPILNVIFLEEGENFTLVVENTYHKKPELFQISQKGYSTKGRGRGTGLGSYQEIIGRYQNVYTKTTCDEKMFRQELFIRKG